MAYSRRLHTEFRRLIVDGEEGIEDAKFNAMTFAGNDAEFKAMIASVPDNLEPEAKEFSRLVADAIKNFGRAEEKKPTLDGKRAAEKLYGALPTPSAALYPFRQRMFSFLLNDNLSAEELGYVRRPIEEKKAGDVTAQDAYRRRSIAFMAALRENLEKPLSLSSVGESKRSRIADLDEDEDEADLTFDPDDALRELASANAAMNAAKKSLQEKKESKDGKEEKKEEKKRQPFIEAKRDISPAEAQLQALFKNLYTLKKRAKEAKELKHTEDLFQYNNCKFKSGFDALHDRFSAVNENRPFSTLSKLRACQAISELNTKLNQAWDTLLKREFDPHALQTATGVFETLDKLHPDKQFEEFLLVNNVKTILISRIREGYLPVEWKIPDAKSTPSQRDTFTLSLTAASAAITSGSQENLDDVEKGIAVGCAMQGSAPIKSTIYEEEEQLKYLEGALAAKAIGEMKKYLQTKTPPDSEEKQKECLKIAGQRAVELIRKEAKDLVGLSSTQLLKKLWQDKSTLVHQACEEGKNYSNGTRTQRANPITDAGARNISSFVSYPDSHFHQGSALSALGYPPRVTLPLEAEQRVKKMQTDLASIKQDAMSDLRHKIHTEELYLRKKLIAQTSHIPFPQQGTQFDESKKSQIQPDLNKNQDEIVLTTPPIGFHLPTGKVGRLFEKIGEKLGFPIGPQVFEKTTTLTLKRDKKDSKDSKNTTANEINFRSNQYFIKYKKQEFLCAIKSYAYEHPDCQSIKLLDYPGVDNLKACIQAFSESPIKIKLIIPKEIRWQFMRESASAKEYLEIWETHNKKVPDPLSNSLIGPKLTP